MSDNEGLTYNAKDGSYVANGGCAHVTAFGCLFTFVVLFVSFIKVLFLLGEWYQSMWVTP